jgi:hypothetical protein
MFLLNKKYLIGVSAVVSIIIISIFRKKYKIKIDIKKSIIIDPNQIEDNDE